MENWKHMSSVLGDFGKNFSWAKIVHHEMKGREVKYSAEAQLFISGTIDYSIFYRSVVDTFYSLNVYLFILMFIRELCSIFGKEWI